MKVLFCGGGTAGHVYPNIAIYEALKKNVPNIKFAYVATEKGIENQIINFKKFSIPAIGLNKGKALTSIVKFTSKMLTSVKKSKNIIKEFKPDIIIGTGGFATFPVIYAGHKLGVKTVVHESNLIPGKSIKSLEKFVDLILVNFEGTKDYFKNQKKIKRVGNPLRSKYFEINEAQTKEKLGIKKENKVILSFGGSLGAKRINDAIISLVENWLKYNEGTDLFFITGKKDYNRVKKIFMQTGLNKLENVKLLDFCFNIPEVMASADIVISRAGAMTISELSQSGKCSILVPSPNVSNNHQFKNAELLSSNGAAILMSEDKLYNLVDVVKDLITDDKKRKKYAEKIKKFTVNDSNKLICKEILNLVKK